jgi:hypothetical protein
VCKIISSKITFFFSLSFKDVQNLDKNNNNRSVRNVLDHTHRHTSTNSAPLVDIGLVSDLDSGEFNSRQHGTELKQLNSHTRHLFLQPPVTSQYTNSRTNQQRKPDARYQGNTNNNNFNNDDDDDDDDIPMLNPNYNPSEDEENRQQQQPSENHNHSSHQHGKSSSAAHKDTSSLLNGPDHCHVPKTADELVEQRKHQVVWRKLISVLILCTLFMVGEIVGGILANSISIQTDAAHMAADIAGFFFSILAIYISTKSMYV